MLAFVLSELHQSEEYFWRNTPRKIIALIGQKQEIDKEKLKAGAVYTACCVWGENPDKLESDEVIGIDKPVDPSQLKGWY